VIEANIRSFLPISRTLFNFRSSSFSVCESSGLKAKGIKRNKKPYTFKADLIKMIISLFPCYPHKQEKSLFFFF